MLKKCLAVFAAVLICCIAAAGAMAVEAVTITSVRDNGDGSVTINWDNPNGGPVTVGSLVMGSPEAGNVIMPEFDVYGDTYTFRNLAPGMEYLLLAMPEVDLDHAGIETVSVSEPPAFDRFKLTIKDVNLAHFVPTKDDYKYNYSHNLSNQEIYEMLDEEQFMVKVDFRHSVFRNAFAVPMLTVVTSPTGFVMTDFSDDVKIYANSEGFWRTMVYMNGAFEQMHSIHGEIPRGKYSVKIYVEGGFAGESSFTIN